jgi:hypothetical protein
LDNAGYLQRHLRGLVDMVVLGGSAEGPSIERQRDLMLAKAAAFVEAIARRPRAASAAPSTVSSQALAA